MTDAYINEYTKHVQIAEPAEHFHDRGILYTAAINDIRYLVEKYQDEYEGYARKHGLDVGISESNIVKVRILGNSLAACSNSAVAAMSDGGPSVSLVPDSTSAQDAVLTALEVSR